MLRRRSASWMAGGSPRFLCAAGGGPRFLLAALLLALGLAAGCESGDGGGAGDVRGPAADVAEPADGRAGVDVAPPDPCADGVRGVGESDVDCGGGCAPCAVDARCDRPADCASGVCGHGNRCLPATCGNGLPDEGETWPDCGGPCPVCPGEPCEDDAGCSGGYCLEGVCRVALCEDRVRNGHETDVDCGGQDCAPCMEGQTCSVEEDCSWAWCFEGACRQPTCDDGVANGFETDVDCGGSATSLPCEPCAEGAACRFDGDCRAGVCAADRCTTCFDGVAPAPLLLTDDAVYSKNSTNYTFSPRRMAVLGDTTWVWWGTPELDLALAGVTELRATRQPILDDATRNFHPPASLVAVDGALHLAVCALEPDAPEDSQLDLVHLELGAAGEIVRERPIGTVTTWNSRFMELAAGGGALWTAWSLPTDSPPSDVAIARWDGGDWEPQGAPLVGIDDLSMVFDVSPDGHTFVAAYPEPDDPYGAAQPRPLHVYEDGGAPVTIAEGLGSSYFDLRVAPDGAVHVVFGRDGVLVHRVRVGGLWSEETEIGRGGRPVLGFDAASVPSLTYVIGADDEDTSVLATRAGDGSWRSTPLARASSLLSAVHVVDGAGRRHVTLFETFGDLRYLTVCPDVPVVLPAAP